MARRLAAPVGYAVHFRPAGARITACGRKVAVRYTSAAWEAVTCTQCRVTRRPPVTSLGRALAEGLHRAGKRP